MSHYFFFLWWKITWTSLYLTYLTHFRMDFPQYNKHFSKIPFQNKWKITTHKNQDTFFLYYPFKKFPYISLFRILFSETHWISFKNFYWNRSGKVSSEYLLKKYFQNWFSAFQNIKFRMIGVEEEIWWGCKKKLSKISRA